MLRVETTWTCPACRLELSAVTELDPRDVWPGENAETMLFISHHKQLAIARAAHNLGLCERRKP